MNGPRARSAAVGASAQPDRSAHLTLAEDVVAHEYRQFQQVQGADGRAACQDDWPTFHQMRLAQFLNWPTALLRSYAGDLGAADASGRNLLTEKYARMMSSTEPERYARELEPHLPVLEPERVALTERIVERQVAWAADFMARYPRLSAGMRVLRTAQDTLTDTSFETYLRGELGSYSAATLAGYGEFVDGVARQGGNLTEQTLRWTVLLAGYADLAEAERAQG